MIRNSVSVSRKSLDLNRTVDESWWIPVDENGALRWDAADLLDELPELRKPTWPQYLVALVTKPGEKCGLNRRLDDSQDFIVSRNHCWYSHSMNGGSP